MSTTSRRHARRVAVAAAALALAAVAAPALGAGNDAADTCLNGYVWREATPADHVCVTPLVRMQTARQNADAAAHHDPAGPDTCLSGYVWREAVAGDHVCVFPTWRQQARDDNAQVAARRNSLHVWLTRYRPSQPPCTGSPCSQHSDDAQRYRVRADHINVGNAIVLVRWTDRGQVKTRSWSRPVAQNPDAPGGLLVFASGMLRCPSEPVNGYFAVRDPVSLQWSSHVPVRTGCATL